MKQQVNKQRGSYKGGVWYRLAGKKDWQGVGLSCMHVLLCVTHTHTMVHGTNTDAIGWHVNHQQQQGPYNF